MTKDRICPASLRPCVVCRIKTRQTCLLCGEPAHIQLPGEWLDTCMAKHLERGHPVVIGRPNHIGGGDVNTTDRVWGFITEYMAEHGYAPSHREIMAGAQVISTSVVEYHVDKLADKGIITKGPLRTARTLRLNRQWVNP